jgi:hypothetical protein
MMILVLADGRKLICFVILKRSSRVLLMKQGMLVSDAFKDYLTEK